MPSAAHEAFVHSVSSNGKVVTPTVFPSEAELHELRRIEEAERPVPPHDTTVGTVAIGGIPCLRVAAGKTDPSQRILYFHGGGYIWMTPVASFGALAELSRASGIECLAPYYRRAPEHPFPAAVEDAVSVYRALLEHTAPGEIVFAGDSAGGGLAIAALLASQSQGLPMPAAAFVFSPWTDLAVTGASADSVDDPIVNGAGLRMMASAYLAGADPKQPLASPLYATEEALKALPPLLVQVGTREALLDDSLRFVAKAHAAGANVHLAEHEGVVHMWMVMAPHLPESQTAYSQAAEFVRRVIPATADSDR